MEKNLFETFKKLYINPELEGLFVLIVLMATYLSYHLVKVFINPQSISIFRKMTKDKIDEHILMLENKNHLDPQIISIIKDNHEKLCFAHATRIKVDRLFREALIKHYSEAGNKFIGWKTLELCAHRLVVDENGKLSIPNLKISDKISLWFSKIIFATGLFLMVLGLLYFSAMTLFGVMTIYTAGVYIVSMIFGALIILFSIYISRQEYAQIRAFKYFSVLNDESENYL